MAYILPRNMYLFLFSVVSILNNELKDKPATLLFGIPGGRRALALLHGHEIADISQHSLQVSHLGASTHKHLIHTAIPPRLDQLENVETFVRQIRCVVAVLVHQSE